MSGTDIIAYAFNAELLCPRCTFEALGRTSTGPVRGGSTELASEITLRGYELGMGKHDPRWRDSGVIPQPVFAHEEREGNEACGRCGDVIE